MFPRVVCLAVWVAALALLVSPVQAQADDSLRDLMGKESFGAAERSRIKNVVEELVKRLVTGNPDEVNGARSKLLDLIRESQVTPQFRAEAVDAAATSLTNHLKEALVHRSRLAVAIVAAKLQNPESLPLLLSLLGQAPAGEAYPSVRYWAARGLAEDSMVAVIRRGEPVPTRTVLKLVTEALDRETDPICAKALFLVLSGIQTEPATDALVAAASRKARDLDLGRPEVVEAMKTAVEGLKDAFARDIRPPDKGKQPIVASLVQILVQTPPHDGSLDVISEIDTTLAELTKEKTGLAEAVKELEDQNLLTRPQLIDAVWLEQLNWVEVLLKTQNKDVRLLARPQLLDWTPEKSTEVVRKAATQTP